MTRCHHFMTGTLIQIQHMSEWNEEGKTNFRKPNSFPFFALPFYFKTALWDYVPWREVLTRSLEVEHFILFSFVCQLETPWTYQLGMTWVEEMLEWGPVVRYFFFQYDQRQRAQPLVIPSLGRSCWDLSMRGKSEHARENKPVSNSLSWSLHQLLPPSFCPTFLFQLI